MSSDIQFDMYNYTNYTLITQSTGEKHIDDDGAALNDLQASSNHNKGNY